MDTDHGPRPQLKYLDGSFCPQDRHTKMSSQIDFYCDPAAGKVLRICLSLYIISFKFISIIPFSRYIQGTPILQGITNDCHHEFEWATNIMCPMHVAEFHKNTCEIYNNQTQQSIDLKTIFENGIVTVRKNLYSTSITLACTIHRLIWVANKYFMNYSFFPLWIQQLNYNNQPIQVDLCKNDKKIEVDYTQSTIKMFFDQNAKCGQDGKRIVVPFHSILFILFR